MPAAAHNRATSAARLGTEVLVKTVSACRGQGARCSIRSQRDAGGAVADIESPRCSAAAAHLRPRTSANSSAVVTWALCYEDCFGQEAADQDQLVGLVHRELAYLDLGA
jgi:hypothetical protein